MASCVRFHLDGRFGETSLPRFIGRAAAVQDASRDTMIPEIRKASWSERPGLCPLTSVFRPLTSALQFW
jgi:hypothetical protein